MIYFNKDGQDYYFSNTDISVKEADQMIALCNSTKSQNYCLKGGNNLFVAIFSTSLFKELVDSTNTDNYHITVKSLNKVLYKNFNIKSNNLHYVFEYDFSLLGKPWSTSIYFTDKEYESLLPLLPNLYFILGFIISSIVLLLFYLADQYASKAAKAEALMQQEKELRILSSTDTLTGVLNRGAFLKLLPSILTKAIANNSSVAVLYIDIDDFIVNPIVI